MSVIRVKHDKNYVCIHKGALEDPNLSFKAKGLWTYCMSKTNDWEFHVNHLSTVSKDGEDAIYSALKELENHGYVKKVQTNIGGRFGPVDYEVYETPQLKISLPHRDFPDAGFPDAGNPALVSNDSLLVSNDKQSNRSAVPPISAEAESLCDLFLKKIKERNPHFKDPNLVKWKSCMDLLLRIDKRDPELTLRIIEWASEHIYWKTGCLSPEKLRKSWDEMFMQMNAQSERELIQQNRSYALRLKDKHPDEMKGFTFDDKFAINRSLAKEIPFNLPHETFKKALVSMFGGEYVATPRG